MIYFTNLARIGKERGIIHKFYAHNTGEFSKLLLQKGSETANDKDGHITIIRE